MKSTKKFKAAAICAVALCGAGLAGVTTPRLTMPSAWAQEANPHSAKVHQLFDELAAKANLSEAQKLQIAAILRHAAPKAKAILEDTKLTQAQKQDQLQELRGATRDKVAQILTAEQRDKAAQLFANRRQIVREALQKVADELEMTTEQRQEARPILQNAFKEAGGIVHDANLTFPQKRDKLMQLRLQTREKLNSILTAEQQKELDQIRDAVRSEIWSRVKANLPALAKKN